MPRNTESPIGAHAATAAKVKRARKRAGMTQVEFALALGVHPMTVSKWERGTVKPGKSALARAALIVKGGIE